MTSTSQALVDTNAKPFFQLAAIAAIMITITIGAPYALRFSDSPFIALMLCHAALALLAMRIAAAQTGRRIMLLIFGAAIIMRVLLVMQPPLLSDDMYRYIWDGRIENAGFNPFGYVPADERLKHLRDSVIYPLVDKKDYAVSIYPPIAQFIFAATVFVSDSLVAMKLAMLLFEAMAIVSVLYLLDRLGRPRALIVGYLWHPAALWEIANNSHVDAAMMGLVFAAFALGISRGRAYLAGALLGAAALVKPTAALVLPVIWRPFDIRLPAFVLALALLLYVPFLSVGTGVFGFLGGYVREQRLDTGGSFYLVNLLSGQGPPAKWLMMAYYAVSAALLIALVLRTSFDTDHSLERSLRNVATILITFLFLLSPDYPWYLLVLLPFVPLIGSWSAFAMTSAGFLLYDVVVDDFSLHFFVRSTMYNALVATAIVCDLMRSSRNGREGAKA